MSTNRAGRIVRCPQCKSPIKIPEIPASELATGKPIDCNAIRVRHRDSVELDNSIEDVEPTRNQLELKDSIAPIEPSDAPGSTQIQVSENSSQQPRLLVPEVLKPNVRKKILTGTSVSNDSGRVESREPVSAEIKVLEDQRSGDQRSGDQGSGDSTAGDSIVGDLNEGDSIAGEKASSAGESAIDVSPPAPGNSDRGENAFPIIDVESDIESPLDWVDGEGVQIIVRDSSKRQNPLANSKSPARKRAANIDPASELGPAHPAPESPVPQVSSSPRQSKSKQPSGGNVDAEVGDRKQSWGPKKRAIDARDLPKPELSHVAASQATDEPPLVPDLDYAPTLSSLLIDLGGRAGEFSTVASEKDWQDRLEKSNSDRKTLARFFALCLCIVSVVNMVPAIYHWYQWTQLVETMPLPRWIYMLIFVGAIHFVYAIFLAQIPDWSAMRAVSIAMLVIAFVFGFVSTGLLVGGGQGNLSEFFGIPFALNRQASIWCVAMLCLATLMSYWAGKESSNWQRAEHLLREILTSSTGPA